MSRMLFACFAALIAPAMSAQEIRPQEQARLDRFERAAGTAVLAALASGVPTDVAALVTALSGRPQVI